MTSITTWLRCEPHSRSTDLIHSLEMRLQDPLWILGRQWQFGEFLAEDAGSPVWAEWTGSSMPLELYLPGVVPGHKAEDIHTYSSEVPLECLVEQEHTQPKPAMVANRRLAVEAGQQFLRMLPKQLTTADYRAALRQTCGLRRLESADRDSIDEDSLAFLDLVADKALDGVLLLEKIQGHSAKDAALAMGFGAAADQAVTTINAWSDWVERVIGPLSKPASSRTSWNSARMEYAFALSAPVNGSGAQLILEAKEYDGGSLDWYSVDQRAGKLARDTQMRPEKLSGATLPTGLHFRGMPSARLWEFEDGQVNIGGVSAAATDLTRLLFVEFFLQYGNDFYVVPIDLSYGHVCRIDQVEITDTFGKKTISSPFVDSDWRMFSLSDSSSVSGAAAGAPVLFLPPVLGQDLASPSLEKLHLLRDEMANISWAIEQVVESRTGKPLNRHEAYQARRQKQEADVPPKGQGQLTYQLDTWVTTLPEYWFPLLNSTDNLGMLELHESTSMTHTGRLLTDLTNDTQGKLYDESIPRSGAIVERVWQYCRWHEGAVYCWISRKKRNGRGEGSSGLSYDVVKTTQEADAT